MDETIVSLYMRVVLELRGAEDEQITVVIVPDASADFGRGLLGESTALAKTILGAKPGQTLDYRQGDLKAVRIISIEPAPEVDPLAAAQRRRQEAARTEEEIAARNAAAFAASFSGKWGDYDPDGVEQWQKSDEKDEGKDKNI